MSIFSGLDEIVEADCVLAKHTWYGLGGPADYFIRPKSTNPLIVKFFPDICASIVIKKKRKYFEIF